MRDQNTAERLCRVELDNGWLEVWQEGSRRSLWFDDGILQTEIDLERPAVLTNPVNRAMLAHLLFRSPPRQVVLAGCGGGALARWFAWHFPKTAGRAIELEPTVARIAHTHFQFPPPQRGWQIIHGDARECLQDCDQQDYVLVDIAYAGYTPAWVSERAFLETLYRALTARGVACVNLIPRNSTDFARRLLMIREIFRRRTLCLSVPGHENVLVFGFRTRPPTKDLDTKAAPAAAWHIEFPELLRRLLKDNPKGSGVF